MRAATPSADLLEQRYSSRLGRAGTVFVALAGTYLVVQAWSASTRAGVLTLLAVVASLSVAYVFAWRPEVVVDDAGVLLRNLVRDVHVPWNRLERVGTRWALSLETTDGRSFPSWAVTARNRSRDSAGRRGVGGVLAGQDLGALDRRLGVPADSEPAAGLRDHVTGGSTGLVSERIVTRWERCKAAASGEVRVRVAVAPVACLVTAAALVAALAVLA